ncbi:MULTISPECIES: heme-binding protein [Bradyrhizobium]|uniref:Heme-binding protein n=1 Tax=Bradyrhizobium diversitatis TaxID=2755406 RepID=A0ABS0P6T9_9BRAD|nr:MULTISPECIES: heme-binding protein [Bradyrhizobium]MBH5388966.1 heme-binding protein [Bradyrhizobium diversitatis]UPJ69351.1 heme-binding protein [Bradyrhizobium sp. 191]
MSLTEQIVERAMAAGRAAAREIGVPMNIAVLDAAAHIKSFVRMDGALLGSIDIALGKARTAALFGMNSEAVGEFCKPGGSSPGLELTNGTLVIFAGGVPIRDGTGALLGAIGVSGGAVAQDALVAQAAAAAAQSKA